MVIMFESLKDSVAGGSLLAVGADGSEHRGSANQFLQNAGWKYRIESTAGHPVLPVPALATAHTVGVANARILMGGPGDAAAQLLIDAYPQAAIAAGGSATVTYEVETMFHIGVEAYPGEAAPNTTGRMGLTDVAPYRLIYGDGLRSEEALTQGPKLTGRYSFKVWPSERSSAHNDFRIADHAGQHGIRKAIGSVNIQWTGAPVLELELVDLSPKVQISPVQSLWLPQREIYYQGDLSVGTEVQFQTALGVPADKQDDH